MVSPCISRPFANVPCPAQTLHVRRRLGSRPRCVKSGFRGVIKTRSGLHKPFLKISFAVSFQSLKSKVTRWCDHVPLHSGVSSPSCGPDMQKVSSDLAVDRNSCHMIAGSTIAIRGSVGPLVLFPFTWLEVCGCMIYGRGRLMLTSRRFRGIKVGATGARVAVG